MRPYDSETTPNHFDLSTHCREQKTTRYASARPSTGASSILILAFLLLSSLSAAGAWGAAYVPILKKPLRGDCETPDLGTGLAAYAYDPDSVWDFMNGGGLAGNGSAFTFSNPDAPQGDQVLFIQNQGQAEQTFGVIPGRFRFSLKAAQRIQGGSPNQQVVRVLLDGLEVMQLVPESGTYQSFTSQTFLLGGGLHTVVFEGLNPTGGDNTVFIDDLQLSLIPVIGDAWSEPASWGGALPGPGTEAVIPAGQVVVLDSAVQLKSLRVEGELICADDAVLSLEAEWIAVFGRFECGSELSPFLGELTITLVGADDGFDFEPVPGQPGLGMGDKFLGAKGGGIIELHGEPKLSWTRLAATAAPGDQAITVFDAVDWQAGDQLVIAPTGESYDEAETVTIESIESDLKTLHLEGQLQHQHWGEQYPYSNTSRSWTVDERAEVGLLSRNIRIRGDSSLATLGGYGGHMIAMPGTTMHVEGVELFQMGQNNRMGRYPFHWHLVEEAPGQYIRNSSIHWSYNRCVTVHGTHDTLVADNVCYKFLGHGYFLEDGIEQRNVFDHNLGVMALKPSAGEALLETDHREGAASNGPAVFWIAHPDNTYTNNAAAGSEGTGFWYGMTDQVTGLSSYYQLPGYDINPRTAPFGTFSDNSVRSSRQGFSSCRNAGGAMGMDPQGQALIENLTVTHTGQGIWPCSPRQLGESHRFVGAVVANSANGMQAPNPMKFESSIFVAYTPNTPSGAEPGAGVDWRGVQVYDQGFWFEDVHFVNYDRPAMTAFYPGGGAHKLTNNRAEGLSFDNSPHLFLDPDNRAERAEGGPSWWGDVVHDLDGSFAGLDHAVVPDHRLMYDGSCRQPTNLEIDGYACPFRFGQFRYDYLPQTAWAERVTVLRSDGENATAAHLDQRFLNDFILDGGYFYSYRFDDGIRHERVEVRLTGVLSGDTAVYELLDVPPSVTVPGWAEISLAQVFDGAPTRGYHYRDGSLFLKMLATGDAWHANDYVLVCMKPSCSQATYAIDPPSVDLTHPADGARFPVGTTIGVNALLSDSDGIAEARLYLGTALQGVDTTAPYGLVLSGVPAGSYPLKLVVRDNSGETYTEVRQVHFGEAAPRVEITSIEDDQTFDAGDPIQVSFDLHNWAIVPGFRNLRWLVDGEVRGDLYSAAPFTVSGLGQGKHEIRVALVEAGVIKAINDTVRVYVVDGGMIADFEDGVDRRGTVTHGPFAPLATSQPRFAWGTRDPVASRADTEDDMNYFDLFGFGIGHAGTYRLELSPPQDWSSFGRLEIKTDGALYVAYAIDATSGATSLGSKVSPTTSHYLPASAAKIDEVVAIELRWDAGVLPEPLNRQHLRHMRLLP